MNVSFVDGELLESEALLKEFEELIQWELPDDFRDFVKKYNGAQTEGCVCFKSELFETVFDTMLNFNRTTQPKMSIWEFYDFIDEHYDWYKKQKYDEKYGELSDYFVFAVTVFGDNVCFNKKNGAVYHFDHESCELGKIADSFSEFLNSLYVDDDDEDDE